MREGCTPPTATYTIYLSHSPLIPTLALTLPYPYYYSSLYPTPTPLPQVFWAALETNNASFGTSVPDPYREGAMLTMGTRIERYARGGVREGLGRGLGRGRWGRTVRICDYTGVYGRMNTRVYTISRGNTWHYVALRGITRLD